MKIKMPSVGSEKQTVYYYYYFYNDIYCQYAMRNQHYTIMFLHYTYEAGPNLYLNI